MVWNKIFEITKNTNDKPNPKINELYSWEVFLSSSPIFIVRISQRLEPTEPKAAAIDKITKKLFRFCESPKQLIIRIGIGNPIMREKKSAVFEFVYTLNFTVK